MRYISNGIRIQFKPFRSGSRISGKRFSSVSKSLPTRNPRAKLEPVTDIMSLFRQNRVFCPVSSQGIKKYGLHKDMKFE